MKNFSDSNFEVNVPKEILVANARDRILDSFQDKGHEIGTNIGNGIANFTKSATNIATIVFVGSGLFIINVLYSTVRAVIDSFVPKKRSEFDSIN